MRLLKPACVAAVLLLGLTLLAQAHQKQNNGNNAGAAAPNLVIETATHDFGEVKTGTPLKWTFKVKNTGKADLLIKNVSPS
jgi:archaellum component FlaG (FlaF/FlaG flagellin family)